MNRVSLLVDVVSELIGTSNNIVSWASNYGFVMYLSKLVGLAQL